MAKNIPNPKAQPKAQPGNPVPSTPKTPSGPQDAFDFLWERFTVEANFNTEILEAEAEVVREEITRLEARIAEKKEELEAILRRDKTARDMLTMMLTAGFSHDAIISAMKVEFRAKKPVKLKEPEVNDDEKQVVLDVLDREGQPLQEVVKTSGREAKDVQRILGALVAEGKVVTQGEKRARIYMLA